MFITREYIRSNPDTIFVFGDNLLGVGLGGQAKVARGQPNAIGIPTKKAPSMDSSSFFTDDQFEQNKKNIDDAMGLIKAELKKGKKLHIIKGIGTGLAKMDKLAPKTYTYMVEQLNKIRIVDDK